jgi:hypothetical protein
MTLASARRPPRGVAVDLNLMPAIRDARDPGVAIMATSSTGIERVHELSPHGAHADLVRQSLRASAATWPRIGKEKTQHRQHDAGAPRDDLAALPVFVVISSAADPGSWVAIGRRVGVRSRRVGMAGWPTVPDRGAQ